MGKGELLNINATTGTLHAEKSKLYEMQFGIWNKTDVLHRVNFISMKPIS